MNACRVRTFGLLSAAALALSACSGGWFGGHEDKPLPGKRIAVLTQNTVVKADPRIADIEVRLPRPEANADWPQAGGLPNHAMYHLQAPGALNKLWSSSIGDGTGDDGELLAQPIVADGRVYTIDVNADVRAFDTKTGDIVWERELSRSDSNEGILGGGLAFERGRLYATTGFADVIAMDARTGKEIWRKRMTGPIRAAPTVRGGRVFVVTVTNELSALAASDGRQLWTHSGLTELAGLVGGAAPAVDAGVVVVAYTSGEIVALRVENGRTVWSESLAALRRSDAVTAISQIRGLPVIDRGIVYAVANSERTVAIDLRTGTRLWEVDIGGRDGPWVAGDYIYVTTREGEVVCLTRRGGRIRWVTQLPKYEDPEDKSNSIQWTEPVLASDRLLVGGTQSEMWSLSPYSGKILGRIDMPGRVLIPPAVAGGTVYVLTDNAELVALR